MRTHLVIFMVMLSLSFAAACREEPQCFEDWAISTEMEIKDITRDGVEKITEQTSGAGLGSAIGAVSGVALAAATGGVSPVLAGVGGSVVGGYSGGKDSTIRERNITACRFRFNLGDLPLVYYGKEDDGDDAFKKCTMLQPGDKVELRITRKCSAHTNKFFPRFSYKWISGNTEGLMY